MKDRKFYTHPMFTDVFVEETAEGTLWWNRGFTGQPWEIHLDNHLNYSELQPTTWEAMCEPRTNKEKS